MTDRGTAFDCIVCGSCVADVVCRPVRLDVPIGGGALHATEPMLLTGGGITINAGVAMARLGLRVGVLSYVGADAWAGLLRDLLQRENVSADLLHVHPTDPTSTTVVVVDEAGERSFLHCGGAPRRVDSDRILQHRDLLARTGFLLVGYYSLLPDLEADLPEVFAEVRQTGCRTALDAAGDGGTLEPLDRILPELDVYVPSLGEARHQTGEDDPRRIIEVYRGLGATGLLGVKRGKDGVLLSPAAGEFLQVDALVPPGAVVDTTGAGDTFLAGLLTGLQRGLSVEQAGRLGAATAACCVTALGGSTGVRGFAETSRLAGLAEAGS